MLACPAFLSTSVTERRNCALGWAPSGHECLPVSLGASRLRPALWTVGGWSGATCLSVALGEGPAGRPRMERGRAGELLNSSRPWGCGRRLCGRGTLGRRSTGSHVDFFRVRWKSPLGNLTDVENSYWNPREVTSLGPCLPWHGGNLLSPAEDVKRSHDGPWGSPCSGQVQGQNARIRAGLLTASRDPRRPTHPPPTRNTPPVCLTKGECWLVVADSHVVGVVLIAEVLSELRKHKQMMWDIHPCT